MTFTCAAIENGGCEFSEPRYRYGALGIPKVPEAKAVAIAEQLSPGKPYKGTAFLTRCNLEADDTLS